MLFDFGPRFICRRRVHHGFAGIVVAVIGVVLMADDIHDWRVWISDFRIKVR